jgi:hypothetical protein
MPINGRTQRAGLSQPSKMSTGERSPESDGLEPRCTSLPCPCGGRHGWVLEDYKFWASRVGLHKRRRTQVDTTQDVPTETEPPLATEDVATETETDVRYVRLLLTRKVAATLKVPIIFPWLTLRVVHPPRTMRSGKIKKTFLTRRPYRITSGCPSHSLVRHCSAGWAGSPASRRAVTRIGASSSLGYPPHDPRCSVSGLRSAKSLTMEAAEVAARLLARMESIHHPYA